MSGTTYNNRSTEITRSYYNALLATNPRAVTAVRRANGNLVYYTYHLTTY